ncbi:MAG: VIT domain-containing protein, partial [Planctomycetota bacterium]|nr:VIT domain-containing protein [Planctomycetota bacterium]
MRASLLVLLILAAAGSLTAQTAGPSLVVREGDVGSLHLASVQVEARILGPISETKITLIFANPRQRDLEGDLYFPLPEGAAICGYALDLDGKMVDGVVVDKQQGAQAYEAIVRRRTDPALLEHVQGNTFRARVFPIPHGGTRTVSVRYVVDLAERDEGLVYQLPLNFKEKVGEFRLRIEVAQAAGEPKILKGGLDGLAFQPRGGALVAEAAAKNVALTEPLLVALPRAGERDVAVEKANDGKTYFYLKHGLPAKIAAAAPAAPKRITVLWDGSGSRAGADLGRQRRLLASCLARLGKGPVAVDLVVFRNAAAPPQRFTVQDGRAEELLKAVAQVDYDGGTQLASLSLPPGVAPPDYYLLFTDGLSTFGKEMPESLGAPVFILVEGAAADRLLLSYLALRHGGALLDLDRMTDDEILPRIGRPV